ncbi:hypothetical protein LTR36_002137 [Oleoguttula mirabilis]|uniref:Heterokaryon incompatibility domain-containing protein n=1 Tax=Oleoguttula mirabilis TaxID=1507867 RepID=A0AAV9JND4_9PEZI|nr:hypothetical protein LTR36_002137 [Oleoguttula mirabilis]
MCASSDFAPAETILLNGHRQSVPASTAAALRCMRLNDQRRTVWIDAVCINQLDLEERGQQVAVMGPIFESSDGNLVYLGEDNGLTEQAFESVYALADEIKDEVGEQDFTNFIRDEHGAVKISSKALGCGINEDALLDLYDRPWFTYVLLALAQNQRPRC